MAHASGDTPLFDPNSPSKSTTTTGEQDLSHSSAPSFPNTRWMPATTDFSRNPGTFDDVFKKIKGKIHLFLSI
jgi:hypothetical protein